MNYLDILKKHQDQHKKIYVVSILSLIFIVLFFVVYTVAFIDLKNMRDIVLVLVMMLMIFNLGVITFESRRNQKNTNNFLLNYLMKRGKN